MKTGIYGGTFNPPHRGHTESGKNAVERLGLDRLIVLPAGMPPHKSVPVDSPSPEMRLEMARLAFENVDRAQVSDMEVARRGVSYTIDTLTELRRENPEDELFLIMGTDMFLTLESWKNGPEMLSMVTPVVLPRGEHDRGRLEARAADYRKKYGSRTEIIYSEIVDISSSRLRELLKNRGGTEYVEDGVYAYIVKNRIYGVKVNFPWLRKKAYAMLNPKRVPHVKGCEKEAARLAARWGADEDMAREAAILHDITKKLSVGEQLILCEKYGILIDDLERASDKLLHGKTGAEIARNEFGVSEPVYEAIKWHTTGKRDMSLLEKVIYLADYIEETRNFEGVERLRALSYEDIDRAMILGLEMSIDDLNERGITVHPNTQEALDYLRGQIKK